tara:strand:+ start:411 stop:590 length:180 start_codon:yes stop_codon:yes gene_type:complete
MIDAVIEFQSGSEGGAAVRYALEKSHETAEPWPPGHRLHRKHLEKGYTPRPSVDSSKIL